MKKNLLFDVSTEFSNLTFSDLQTSNSYLFNLEL